jgi:hypothetical protein
MPLISNSGIFQEIPPKLFPGSFGKVPANPNRGNNWKCLQIQITAVKFKFKFWNLGQNMESQSNSRVTIQILESHSNSRVTIQTLESHSNSSFIELNYNYSLNNRNQNHNLVHAL